MKENDLIEILNEVASRNLSVDNAAEQIWGESFDGLTFEISEKNNLIVLNESLAKLASELKKERDDARSTAERFRQYLIDNAPDATLPLCLAWE